MSCQSLSASLYIERVDNIVTIILYAELILSRFPELLIEKQVAVVVKSTA